MNLFRKPNPVLSILVTLLSLVLSVQMVYGSTPTIPTVSLEEQLRGLKNSYLLQEDADKKTAGDKTKGKVTGETSSGVEIQAPYGVLMEAETGTVIFEKQKDEKRSPASITKIMTLILIFDELASGNLKLTDEVITSAHAKSMGGSQVFLEEGEKQTVETMIKCIVIASGNDASVAMAEHIAGSEAEFVARMNARAKQLGMNHTNFEDCCGLTDSSNHYTTAYDVALMSRELVSKYPKILEYSGIWMEDIVHTTNKGSTNFTLTNTNKLVRGYEGCVGLKTGSTSIAKYCVSAVAKRNNLTLISVVLAAPDYKIRFADAAKMLNFGFGKCKFYQDENTDPLPKQIIKHSLEREIGCSYRSGFRYVDTQGTDLSGVYKEIKFKKNLKAPLKKGAIVGTCRYYLKDQVIGSVDVVLDKAIPKSTYMDYLKKCVERGLL